MQNQLEIRMQCGFDAAEKQNSRDFACVFWSFLPRNSKKEKSEKSNKEGFKHVKFWSVSYSEYGACDGAIVESGCPCKSGRPKSKKYRLTNVSKWVVLWSVSVSFIFLEQGHYSLHKKKNRHSVLLMWLHKSFIKAW